MNIFGDKATEEKEGTRSSRHKVTDESRTPAWPKIPAIGYDSWAYLARPPERERRADRPVDVLLSMFQALPRLPKLSGSSHRSM